ncbi:MAG: phenylpyruvate tautomerase MIF-related protein [Eubacterium sp.]|nr:phenylpyruvate tautomerase MIF-related protein [Eubacterium sp.]
MPFINSKVTVKISPEKEERIKQRLGQAITIIPGKSESFLMVGFDDEYSLYFKGNKCEKAAFVDVKLYGKATSDACNQMTGEICRIYEEELGIPKVNIYVTYQSIADWGWNGANF